MQPSGSTLISIIVAVYNVKDYLQDCLSSILAQTYDNIEVILVDDGSTDESSDLCEQARKEDCRVRVLHKQNGGLSDARNAGLSISRGEYVTFVDGDDVISRYLVERLFAPIAAGRADFSICSSVEGTNPAAYLVTSASEQTERLFQPEDAAAECLLGSKLTVSAWGKLGKRALWLQHRFPTDRVYEDLSTVPRLICDADVVAFVQEPLYGQVMRIGSITRSNRISNKQYDDYFQAIQANRAYFANHDSKRLRSAFLVREMLEYSRMLRLYLRIDCPNPDSRRIYSEARSAVRRALFKDAFFNASPKARLSAFLGVWCPVLQSGLYDVFQALKRLRPKQG